MNRQSDIKKKLIGWLRYHHFKTMPNQDSHYHFIGVLSFIEGITDCDTLGDAGDLNTSWKEILEVANGLSDDQVVDILNYRERSRG